MAALKRDLSEDLSRGNAVCSDHFLDEDKIISGELVKLKPGAIPTLRLGPVPLKNIKSRLESRIGNPSTTVACDTVTCDDSDHNTMYFFLWNLLLFVWCILLWRAPRTMSYSSESSKRDLSSSTDSTGIHGGAERVKKDLKKSPQQLASDLTNQQNLNKSLKQDLKNANRKIQRLSKKVDNLRDIIGDLRKHDIVSEEASLNLHKSLSSGVPLSLLKRVVQNQKNISKGKQQRRSKFPEELRSFAMTLQFYSSKAYDYVRETFSLALPSPSTIRLWLGNIKCEPGFTENSFETLKALVAKNNTQNVTTICSLILDEISIRKQVEYIGNKTWGYIDFGTGLDDDSLEYATEALVLMVVAVNSNWKLPIAYYFIKSLTGAKKANIVNQALIKLYDVGVTITSVTCDGPNANFTMATQLGAQLSDINTIIPWFEHPIGSYKIYIFFDPCHMLKLLRNNWASLHIFIDPYGRKVDFSFITNLHNLQEQEMLRFGTKLKKAHIQWQKQKMKVNLAAQTISASVADAIDMLRDDFQLPEFANSEATTLFIRLFDRVFDALNSRNPYGVGSKAPIKKNNMSGWKELFDEAVAYLINLRNVNGEFIHKTKNKTPIKGLIIDMKSVVGIFHDYISHDNAPLKYLLPYKLSQDHIELFFLCIRSRNGWNNNPTCHQFMCSYRRLALNLDVKGIFGNCSFRDDTFILNITSSKKITHMPSLTDLNVIRKYDLDLPTEIELNDVEVQFMPKLTPLSKNVVVYISGFVVKKLKTVLKCHQCLAVCESEYSTSDDTNFTLLNRKNRGGLTKPSEDIITICDDIERRLRYMLNKTNNRMPQENTFYHTFIQKISLDLFDNNRVFKNLNDHVQDHGFLEVHPKMVVIRETVKTYTKIRLYSIAKKQTEVITGDLIRKKITKLILFHNQ